MTTPRESKFGAPTGKISIGVFGKSDEPVSPQGRKGKGASHQIWAKSGQGSVTTASGSSSYSGMKFQHNANGNRYTPDTSRGQYLVFNPASGQLAIVPEPSTWVLAAIGVAAVGLKARRRRRAA